MSMSKLAVVQTGRSFVVTASALAASICSIAALAVWPQAGLAADPGSIRPVQLRCEYLKNPLGIDAVHPRLSWIFEAEPGGSRGQLQTAYQILVASSRRGLRAANGDLWDTGRVNSDRSIQIPYRGQPLTSERECYWKVRVWDGNGKPSPWSTPARWTMGLLKSSDWHAQWIGLDKKPGGERAGDVFAGARWIWFPEGRPQESAPVGTRYFRRAVSLPADRQITRAALVFTADNSGTFFINGQRVGAATDFHAAARFEVANLLHPGQNLLAVSVENTGSEPNPAGWIGVLRVEFENGQPLVVRTGPDWKTTDKAVAGWTEASLDDAAWHSAQQLGPAGMAPWGQIAAAEDRRLPARYLRREFKVEKHLRRATVYMSGLGLSELYLNGRKVGNSVLSPALSDYTKRCFYVTYDVTRALKQGDNAVGVILGNGRFYAPRSRIPTGTVSYGFPKLFFQMNLDYSDGSTERVVSDGAWKLTADGPIRANNEYDGEEYDARKDMDGWNKPGLDDSDWQDAQVVAAPGGGLAAQMIEPIRVTQTLRPIAMTEPKPGVYVFDMGQNMVGWCRLKVSGPRGTAVSMRHAETLKPDGMLYVANLRSAKVTDTYILKGQGTEIYEPRFTYHGFRYVEVTGYPGKPDLSDIEGRVVGDDLQSAGSFTCSNPLVNHIYRNIRWGVRGNYRSIPTDCPQRDERQGWLGDRSAESRGETYLFNTAALYTKWLQDMADAQKPSGSVPDVCPAYWPIYSDNVTWPSSTVIIPKAIRDQYADRRVIREHYDSAKKWIEYMSRFIDNGIISRDSYGDWCVPPRDPKLIHSRDPKRQTNKALLATAYFYHDLELMAQYANWLNKPDDAQHFSELATTLKAAFNKKFLNTQAGQYDNGSQTSCVLPLAFGLTPEAQRERIFDHLVEKITNETHGHIGTGLIGGQWLMRVLTDNGRPDLAWTILTQKTYPSWGYMVENGATTIWELWNGNTADPAMNSGNHVMLVGDLGIWLFEDLAGIKPDPAQPGFKHIIMRPEPVGHLRHVRATHRSPYGMIKSEWSREGELFKWNITVPVNTTARVYNPATDEQSVTEGGQPASNAADVQFIKVAKGRAVFSLGSGSYSFESTMR